MTAVRPRWRPSWVCIPLLILMATAQAQQTYQAVGPEMLLQGEEFSMRLVQLTPKGQEAIPQGTPVLMNGIPLVAGANGKIQVPAFFQESGNQFLFITVNIGGEEVRLEHHVEVIWLPQEPGQPSQIAHVSEVCSPGGNLRVEGRGLNDLRYAELKGTSTTYPLDDSVGSSLQRIYTPPPNVPQGNYRFVAEDNSGRQTEAPNTTTNPTLKLTGTQIRTRGQRGQFVVTSDVEGDVLLSGGEPNIQLDTRSVHVTPNKPATVNFTARVVGQYDVNVTLIGPDANPPPDAPAADAQVGELHVEPGARGVSVQSQIAITGEDGKPLANTPVDMALTGPQGLQCSRVTTDENGHATFRRTLPEQAPPGSVGLYCYRVGGHPWSKNKQRKQQPRHYQYAVKFVCGQPEFPVVAPGHYFTAINVHNPGELPARILKKVAVALPGEKAGPISPFFLAYLLPDQALEIDCPDILRHAQVTRFLKGFVVIETSVPLDVVAVYTAGHDEVETEDLVRVPPRMVEPAAITPLVAVPQPVRATPR